MSGWNSTVSIRRASRIHESWHETIDGRSRFKLIPLSTKQKQNQVDQFLLCQVFLLFRLQSFRWHGGIPQGQICDLKHASHPNKTSRPTRQPDRVGGWCFSSDRIEQFTETVHHLHFHREVTSFSRKTSKCGPQVHVHASQYQLETPKIEGICFVHQNQSPSIPTTCYSHFLAISPRFWNSGSGSWQKGVVLECGTRATEMDSMDRLLVGWIGSCWMFFLTTLVTGSCPAGPLQFLKGVTLSHKSARNTWA